MDFLIKTLKSTIARADPNIESRAVAMNACRFAESVRGILMKSVVKRYKAAGMPRNVKDVAVISKLETSCSFSFNR